MKFFLVSLVSTHIYSGDWLFKFCNPTDLDNTLNIGHVIYGVGTCEESEVSWIDGGSTLDCARRSAWNQAAKFCKENLGGHLMEIQFYIPCKVIAPSSWKDACKWEQDRGWKCTIVENFNCSFQRSVYKMSGFKN